ncbi:FMRFamide receptor isoform X2 [Eurytemora carolleeae]|uniref:FMRFamide receptor isoform X2 n=1 Tax=Eurytemora carolleeae TaxID=1294199 RepID=UPI000C76C5C0|nr:FMRFamide receptor isoform X2 [Eurytemora carolleeae]|eukprot:XP_023331763.1 FMRFamide receptor-like isoform X2 [Eurytemora affinis]
MLPLTHTGLTGTRHMFAYSVTFMLPLAHTGLTGSIMLTCGMSLERYITVCHPFFKIAHKWPAWYYLLPIGTISFLYTLPRYFELRVLQINYQLENSTLEDSNITLYSLQPTKLRLNENYVNLYIMWANLIVLGILPYTILLFLNISIFKTIKKMQNDDDLGVLGFNPGIRSQRRKEVNLSKISILIVIVFMVCHSLKWLPTVWEITQKGKALSDYEWPDWIAKISSMSNFLTTLNGSFTALVYFIKQRRFITEHTFVKYIFRSQGTSLERIEELEGSRRNTVFTHLSNSRNVLPLLDQENGDATTEL